MTSSIFLMVPSTECKLSITIITSFLFCLPHKKETKKVTTANDSAILTLPAHTEKTPPFGRQTVFCSLATLKAKMDAE